MNWPFGWELPALIVGATIVALLAGPNLAIAVPAAALAVLAAGLLFAGAFFERGAGSRGPEPPALPVQPRFPNGIAGSRLVRAEVLRRLEGLERAGALTGPSTPPEEQERLLRLPPEEFRRHVRERLDRLEAGG
ncbi:MAG TPA: hypothetical protein VEL82_02580 [Thermoplasmata archaeon]|nr:hypothetical protein [Thermoplasmata archaeon]